MKDIVGVVNKGEIMNICNKCKFQDGEYCVRDYYSLISGMPLNYRLSCEVARKDEGCCGAQGLHFQEKSVSDLKKEKKLHLEVYDDDLHIIYNRWDLAWVSGSTKCLFISIHSIEKYEEWRRGGMLVDEHSQEWGGGVYCIRDCHLERIDITNGRIYDFIECFAVANCHDENIRRWRHNLRPIIF